MTPQAPREFLAECGHVLARSLLRGRHPPTRGLGALLPHLAAGNLRARGNAVVMSATEFYRNNPKKVGLAALVGAAALLGLVKNRGVRRG